MTAGRTPTVAENRHMAKVADLGCIICRNVYRQHTPVEYTAIHHIDGKTKPGVHFLVLPLCGGHHQTGGEGVALHHNKARWVKEFGTEEELLTEVRALLLSIHKEVQVDDYCILINNNGDLREVAA